MATKNATKNTKAKQLKLDNVEKNRGAAFVFPTSKAMKEQAKSAKRAAATAASWENPEVKARRLKHDSVQVTVNGITSVHRSLRDAFKAHTLPDRKHIKFRLELKEKKQLTFWVDARPYFFKIVSPQLTADCVKSAVENKALKFAEKFKVGDLVEHP